MRRTQQRTTAYLQELLVATREELVRADSKAALLLAAAGVGIGAMLAGLISSDWSPFQLANRVEWLWWLGAGCIATAVVRLANAIWPRTRRRGNPPPPQLVAYYADVHAYAGRPTSALRTALAQSASRSDDRLLDQLRQISRIVMTKYLALKQSLVLLALGAALCAAAVLLNA